MIRMIIHSGATVDDFTLKWIDNTTFSIRVRWPKFMQRCMMMTNLDTYTDVNGNLAHNFPPGHPVYLDIGNNAKKLKESDGFIYSEGLFSFQQPMDTQNILIQNYLTLRLMLTRTKILSSKSSFVLLLWKKTKRYHFCISH